MVNAKRLNLKDNIFSSFELKFDNGQNWSSASLSTFVILDVLSTQTKYLGRLLNFIMKNFLQHVAFIETRMFSGIGIISVIGHKYEPNAFVRPPLCQPKRSTTFLLVIFSSSLVITYTVNGLGISVIRYDAD